MCVWVNYFSLIWFDIIVPHYTLWCIFATCIHVVLAIRVLWRRQCEARRRLGSGESRNEIPFLSKCHDEVMAWASCQIPKIAGCDCARNAGNVFPFAKLQMKPLFSDPGMHHGTCVTYVPWCMPGSLARGGVENVTGIPGACATRNGRIW